MYIVNCSGNHNLCVTWGQAKEVSPKTKESVQGKTYRLDKESKNIKIVERQSTVDGPHLFKDQPTYILVSRKVGIYAEHSVSEGRKSDVCVFVISPIKESNDPYALILEDSFALNSEYGSENEESYFEPPLASLRTRFQLVSLGSSSQAGSVSSLQPKAEIIKSLGLFVKFSNYPEAETLIEYDPQKHLPGEVKKGGVSLEVREKEPVKLSVLDELKVPELREKQLKEDVNAVDYFSQIFDS